MCILFISSLVPTLLRTALREFFWNEHRLLSIEESAVSKLFPNLGFRWQGFVPEGIKLPK